MRSTNISVTDVLTYRERRQWTTIRSLIILCNYVLAWLSIIIQTEKPHLLSLLTRVDGCDERRLEAGSTNLSSIPKYRATNIMQQIYTSSRYNSLRKRIYLV